MASMLFTFSSIVLGPEEVNHLVLTVTNELRRHTWAHYPLPLDPPKLSVHPRDSPSVVFCFLGQIARNTELGSDYH